MAYVANENRYHTERESYLFIQKKSASSNDKKEYWEVKTKDGTTYRFGSTKDAEQVSSLEPYVTRWYLDAIIDVLGNTVSYNYMENPSGSSGVNYLNTITYGQNVITFEYGLSPVPSHIFFNQGSQIVQNKVLQSIVEKNGKDVVRKYQFKYTTSGTLVFLQSIQEVGKDGFSTLPATTFQYKTLTSGWTKDGIWALPVALGDTKDLGVRLFDVDGDGLVDITNNGGAVYWKNIGKGFEQKTFPSAFTVNGVVDSEGHDLGVRFGDVNDDTRIDVIQLLIGQSVIKQALLNQGNGWVTQSVTLPAEVAFVEKKTEKILIKDEKTYASCVPKCPSSFCGVKSGSYSCDAKTAECTLDCYRYYCLGSGGFKNVVCSKSDCAGQSTTDLYDVSCDMKLVSEDKQYKDVTYFKELGYRFVDVNGDGKEDLVQSTAQSQKTWIKKGTQWVIDDTWKLPSSVYFVTGDGFDLGVQFVDVNGDGLLDIAEYGPYHKELWLNTGKGWINIPQSKVFDQIWVLPDSTPFLSSTEKYGVVLMDVNGDHLVDVLRSDAKSKAVWINTGKEWKKDTSWDIPAGVFFHVLSTRITDVNGDGAADILYAKNQNEKGTWINNGGQAYLLQSVSESGGKIISFSYQQITALDNTGVDDLADVGMSGWVGSSVTYNNGMSGEHKIVAPYTFVYKDGFYDAKDREFRGFASVEEKRPDGNIVRHSFYQDAIKKGLEYKTELVSSGGVVMDSVEKEFSVPLQNGGYAVVELKKMKEAVMNGGKSVETEVSYEYDSYGNPTVVMNKGDISISSDDTKQMFSYALNPGAWVVGTPSEVKLLDGQNNIVKRTQYYYDGQGLGKVGKGLLSSQQEFVSSTVGITTSQEYDSYGNVVVAKDGKGNVIKFSYDETHTFPVSSTNALGHTATTTYDVGTGKVLSETDANGFVRKYEYDVFGRVLKVIKPYDTNAYPTELYEYGFDGIAPEKVVVKQREVSGKQETYDISSYYDGFGTVVQVQRDGVQGAIVQNVFCDGLGRVVKEVNPYAVSITGGYVTSQSGAARSYSYDPLSQVIEMKNPDGSFKKIEYKGSVITEMDANGHTKQYSVDGFKRILSVTEKNGNEAYVTSYTYRADDVLLKVVDDAKNMFGFTYDLVGRLVKSNDLEVGYNYDQRLRLVEEQKKIDGVSFATQFTYDAMDRLMGVKEGGEDISYQYNGQNMLNAINVGGKNMVTIASNVLGQPVKKIYGNNLVTDLMYDSEQYRLKNMQTMVSGAMLQSLSYTYDSVGNVKSITNKNEQLQMTYDEVDRLISAQKSSTVKPFTATYGYNSIGNMLSANVNGKAMVFGYTGKPVHAPSSIEMEGVVVAEQKGCKDNNSLCSVNKECVENKCELKKGCEYNNPVCAANEDCIKNKCALKKGCIHKNPDCFSDQECINNKCELKKGCDYNNPGCEPTKKCVNNVCMYMQCPGASCPPQQEFADLAVVSFKPVTLDNGKGKAVYELFIKNIGKKTASAVSWEILANSLNSDKVVLASSGSTPIAEFKVGEQKIVYPVFSLPSCKFTIFAYIDSENKIQELDDLNNNVAFTYIDTCGSKTPPPPPVPGDKDKRGDRKST